MSQNKLSDDSLSSVTGGVKTGEFNADGEVYINFPSMVSGLSDYYSVDELEKLAKDYYNLRGFIKMYITNDVKDAVKELYKKSEKEMSNEVKELLGI